MSCVSWMFVMPVIDACHTFHQYFDNLRCMPCYYVVCCNVRIANWSSASLKDTNDRFRTESRLLMNS